MPPTVPAPGQRRLKKHPRGVLHLCPRGADASPDRPARCSWSICAPTTGRAGARPNSSPSGRWWGFGAQTMAPWLEVVTPQQEVIATAQHRGAARAGVVPAEALAAGDTVRSRRCRSPAAGCWRARPVLQASPPLGIFRRDDAGDMQRVPVAPASAPDLESSLAEAGLVRLRSATAQVTLPDGAAGTLTATIAEHAYRPGDAIDLGCSGELGMAGKSGGLRPSAPRRRDGRPERRAPRIFGPALPAQADARSFINDWRRVAIPAAAAPDGDWTLAVGITIRRRVSGWLSATKNEPLAGSLRVRATPVPDQTGALDPGNLRQPTPAGPQPPRPHRITHHALRIMARKDHVNVSHHRCQPPPASRLALPSSPGSGVGLSGVAVGSSTAAAAVSVGTSVGVSVAG